VVEHLQFVDATDPEDALDGRANGRCLIDFPHEFAEDLGYFCRWHVLMQAQDADVLLVARVKGVQAAFSPPRRSRTHAETWWEVGP
jgi:hypothetical protein